MVICNICKEIVTNPICPMCMAKSIKAWLVQNNPKLANVIDSRLSIFDLSDDEEAVSCIKCGRPVNICMYCSSQEIYDWVKESNDELAVRNFPFKF